VIESAGYSVIVTTETLYPQREAIAACFGRRPTGVLAEAGRDLLDEIEKASER